MNNLDDIKTAIAEFRRKPEYTSLTRSWEPRHVDRMLKFLIEDARIRIEGGYGPESYV